MKQLVCIVCPNSCRLTIDENSNVSGHKCKRGIDFAVTEQTNPLRTVCSTVATTVKDYPVISVRTSSEISKSLIFDVMAQLKKIVVATPLNVGDIVISNILNSGIDIISTTNMNIKN